jgi:hypothetical protein
MKTSQLDETLVKSKWNTPDLAGNLLSLDMTLQIRSAVKSFWAVNNQDVSSHDEVHGMKYPYQSTTPH